MQYDLIYIPYSNFARFFSSTWESASVFSFLSWPWHFWRVILRLSQYLSLSASPSWLHSGYAFLPQKCLCVLPSASYLDAPDVRLSLTVMFIFIPAVLCNCVNILLLIKVYTTCFSIIDDSFWINYNHDGSQMVTF